MMRPETWSTSMQPEQLPGSLFVVLTALVAFATQAWLAILLLALGCALGWISYYPDERVKFLSTMLALILWAAGFTLTFIGVY